MRVTVEDGTWGLVRASSNKPELVVVESPASEARMHEMFRPLKTTTTPQHVNISVNIGANLPGDLDIRPLPPSVIELVPEYRGFNYVVVNDEIVIVEPSTRRVVEIIREGGQTQAMATTHVNPCGP